jgi:hypothetical protein
LVWFAIRSNSFRTQEGCPAHALDSATKLAFFFYVGWLVASHYVFTLKMATVMFAETLDNSQRSTRFMPESQLYLAYLFSLFVLRKAVYGEVVTYVRLFVCEYKCSEGQAHI